MQRRDGQLPIVHEEGQGHERSGVQGVCKGVLDVSDGSVCLLISSPLPAVYFCARMLMGHYRNLMAKDEFKNLGFAEEQMKPPDTKKDALGEKGKVGELRWE